MFLPRCWSLEHLHIPFLAFSASCIPWLMALFFISKVSNVGSSHMSSFSISLSAVFLCISYAPSLSQSLIISLLCVSLCLSLSLFFCFSFPIFLFFCISLSFSFSFYISLYLPHFLSLPLSPTPLSVCLSLHPFLFLPYHNQEQSCTFKDPCDSTGPT